MPAASPDSNFVGLAAEEQDAEVTPMVGLLALAEVGGGMVGWVLFWKRPPKVAGLAQLGVGCGVQGRVATHSGQWTVPRHRAPVPA